MVKEYVLVIYPGTGNIYAEEYKIEYYSFIRKLKSKAAIYRIRCPEHQVTIMRLKGLQVQEIVSEDALIEIHNDKFYLRPNFYG